MLCGWLGGFGAEGSGSQHGRLLTIEEVGQILNGMVFLPCFLASSDGVKVPVNLKERDAFHLTIEEYLQSLITLIEELVGFSQHKLGSLKHCRTVFDLGYKLTICRLDWQSIRSRLGITNVLSKSASL